VQAAQKAAADLAALAVLYLPPLTHEGFRRIFLKDHVLPVPEDLEQSHHPHGCIHLKGTPVIPNPVHCDFCPVQNVCRLYKDWSK